MSDEFTPRTVAIVALASLVGGFVAVFGGGMLMLRARTEAAATQNTRPLRLPRPIAPAVADAGGAAAPGVDPAGAPDGAVAGAAETGDGGTTVAAEGDGGGAAAAPVQAGAITITPGSVSRCFEQGSTAPITAGCDALPALDQHMLAKATDIASCSHGHGRLSFVIDFRFSTAFARAWGGPSSTIGDAGSVAACVRRVTAPLPLASITHAHDRYVVVYGIEW